MGRAQLAIQKGDDELAREALSRKATAAEQAETLGNQLEAQTNSLNQLCVSSLNFDSRSSLLRLQFSTVCIFFVGFLHCSYPIFSCMGSLATYFEIIVGTTR